MVVATSFPSSASMYMECVEVPEFNYSIPCDGDGCHAYSFIITPYNAAGNGTSKAVSYSPDIASRMTYCRYITAFFNVLMCLGPNFVNSIESALVGSSTPDNGISVLQYTIRMV